MNWLERAKDFLLVRRQAYHQTFSGPPGQEVLSDLARFCRALDTTFHPDARVQAQLEGRREVFLRIQHHLKLTDEELWALYGQPRK
jgi:hypothetical protein